MSVTVSGPAPHDPPSPHTGYVMNTSSTAAAPALSDQIVLVTGGARGLGQHLVSTFLQQGARVVINYLTSRQQAETLAQQAPQRCFVCQADVTDAQAVQQL